ncbi:MAG: family 43 glycosylhydrolase [Clostridiales bacterium]|nr:family 43 glycosylhydrolase [Clostridiales bacterium]
MNKIIEGILNNDINMIDKARRENPQLPNEREQGLTAVYYAAKYGNLEVNRFMIEKTMSKLNMLDDKKRSVLFYAVEGGDLEVCKYYVERVGHSPLTCDIDGITAFEYAKQLGKEDIVKYFEEYCGFKYEEGYKNPIRRGFFPDPSIVRVGEDYYMVNSSFVYFPCIPISHSKDLVNWQVIGHAITNPDWADLEGLDGGRGYWAPDISYYKGRFYICATYRNNDNEKLVRRQMVTSSEKPEGPYDKPVFIDVDGIDPSIFNDNDGNRYMVLNRGASIFNLSEDAKERVSDVTLLYYGDNKKASEGPHILKKDGWYYLFQAEGGTGVNHMISVSRSRELYGLYEPCPFNPIMTYKELHNPYIRRCGHGKPVMTPDGRWFIVYLCGRLLDEKYTVLGRETCLDELVWTPGTDGDGGWPIINKGRGASAFAKYPLKKHLLKDNTDEDFDGKEIPSVWYSLRGRNEDTFKIENSRLIIKGGKEELDSTDCGSVLLRRQESFDFTAEADGEIYPAEGGSGGLTCYYDENSFFTFGIKKEGGKTYVEVWEKIGYNKKLSRREEISGTGFTFKIITKGLKRSLFINGRSVYIIEDTSYLSDEGVELPKRFTGAMVGMYCTGEGSKAEFERFKITAEP